MPYSVFTAISVATISDFPELSNLNTAITNTSNDSYIILYKNSSGNIELKSVPHNTVVMYDNNFSSFLPRQLTSTTIAKTYFIANPYTNTPQLYSTVNPTSDANWNVSMPISSTNLDNDTVQFHTAGTNCMWINALCNFVSTYQYYFEFRLLSLAYPDYPGVSIMKIDANANFISTGRYDLIRQGAYVGQNGNDCYGIDFGTTSGNIQRHGVLNGVYYNAPYSGAAFTTSDRFGIWLDGSTSTVKLTLNGTAIVTGNYSDWPVFTTANLISFALNGANFSTQVYSSTNANYIPNTSCIYISEAMTG